MADIFGDNNDNVLVGTALNDNIFPRGGSDTITGNGGMDSIRIGISAGHDPVEEGRNGIFDRVLDFAPVGDPGQDEFELTGVYEGPYDGHGANFSIDQTNGRTVRAHVHPTDGITYLLVDENGRTGGSDWVRIARLDGVNLGDQIRVATFVDGTPRSTNVTVTDWPFGWDLVASDDLDGDGNSDNLWRHDNGEVYVWYHNGTAFEGQSLGVVTADWHIAGTGDFAGDGSAGILWRNDDGELLQDGVSRGVIDNVWQVQSVGDFDGNGSDQILWRNGVTGEILIDGQGSLGIVDTAWNVVGTGDFNGDTKDEILWRHTNGAVLLNGVDIGATNGLFTAGDRTIEAIADFNGDGGSDILWRDDRIDGLGEAYIWSLNGTSVTVTNIGQIDQDWEIDAAGDYFGNGASQIFWRHENGDIQLNGTSLGNVVTSYQDLYLI
jgi:hypothetical protein